ncbi:hypothetical protein GF406_02045 [candidate division KSB1 bacterium]|nr:hypothetical protein [candidate division KSB1 bacterium]
MKRIHWAALFLIIFCLQSLKADESFHIENLQTHTSFIQFDVVIDSAFIIQTRLDDTWYNRVIMPGFSYFGQPGLPRLPMSQSMIGVPGEGEVSLSVSNVEYRTIQLENIEPADPALEEPLKEMDEWYPAQFFDISDPAFWREQRVVKLSVNPARYHQKQTLLQLLERATIRIDFPFSAPVKRLSNTVAAMRSSGFEELYRSGLLNYEQCKSWRQSVYSLKKSLTSEGLAPYRYKVLVEEDGVYSVSGDELIKAGIDLQSIVPSSLALSNRGNPVPILVEGGQDGTFDKTDRIIFIGEHNSGKDSYLNFYSETNVYWLTWGKGAGARFAEIPGSVDIANADTVGYARSRIHLEKDLTYQRLLFVPQEELDHWFWQQLNHWEGPEDQWENGATHFDLPIAHPKPEGEVKIQASFFGQTSIPAANPDHKVRVYLNGRKIGNAIWDGKTEYLFESLFFSDDLKSEANRISFLLPKDLEGVNVDAVLLNWLAIEYEKELISTNNMLEFFLAGNSNSIIKMSNFASDQLYVLTKGGQQITNFRTRKKDGKFSVWFGNRIHTSTTVYAVNRDATKKVMDIVKDESSNLKDTGLQADYILITHADFMQSAQELADFRSSQGLSVQLVDVQDIYDEFSHGLYDPHAIKRFISYAYHHWRRPAPLHLLIFGDTTHLMDKSVARQDSAKSFVPSMMEYTRSWGMTSSDNYFVTVQGNDLLPDLFVGRLPAGSVDEAINLVNKVIDYETKSDIDSWQRQVCLLTGTDTGLENMAKTLYRDHIPARMITNFLNTSAESPYFGTTEDLANYFNQGQLMLTFLGHGGGGVYLDTDLFLVKDIELLHNQNKYPVIFSITCFVGHFDNPEIPSLGEELLKAKDKGIVAHFGSAGRAYIGYYDNMHESLHEAIFVHNARTLGEITTLGKFNAQQQGAGYWDHMKNYILMGDPASKLQIADENIDVSLSKSILTDGETLSLSGEIPTPGADTQVNVSVFDHEDEFLLEKNLTIADGKFSGDVFELTNDIRQHWPGLWGEGILRVFYRHAKGTSAVAESFNIDRPVTITHQPAEPNHLQPVTFFINVPDQVKSSLQGIASMSVQWTADQINWQNVPCRQVEGQPGEWKSDVPVTRSGGTRISFKYVINGNNGTQLKSPGDSYVIKKLPDLFTEYNSVAVTGSSDPALRITVRNAGEMPSGAFKLAVFSGLTINPNNLLEERVLESGIPAGADTSLFFSLPDELLGLAKFTIQVDVQNDVKETNEKNNLTNSTQYVISAKKGSGGPIYSADGGYSVDIPPGSPSGNGAMIYRYRNDASYLEAAEQVSIQPINPRGVNRWYACQVIWTDSTMQLSKPMTVQVYYNPNDSVTTSLQTALRMYAWNDSTETWNGLESELDPEKHTVSATLPVGYNTFAMFASTDHTAPKIFVGVKGQNFADGDRVATNPTFTISFEDESGFDVGLKPIQLSLDNFPIPAQEVSIYQEPESRKRVTVTFSPELTLEPHTLWIKAVDINGNVAEQEVQFSVASEFELVTLANHPNPFVDETVIAFTLTEVAEKVTLGIYTVSGRLIRSIELYELTGYYEYEWDGLDEEGNEIANGVYYLKFTAQHQDKRIERIEKMAKLQ